MCLAEFASKYKKSSNKKNAEDIDNEKKITLKNSLGIMNQRCTSAIIRYHQWSVKKQPIEYYHSQLLLYFPWREEKSLKGTSYEETYTENKEVIEQNRKLYEYHAEDVAVAMENIEQFGPPEENWNILAPQTEQMQSDDRREGATEINAVNNAFTYTDNTVNRDLGLAPFEIEYTNEKMTRTEWYDLLLSLNTLQAQLHEYVVHWCTCMLLSHKCGKPDPFYIFLTGGAGVGKSHVVRAIVQTVNNLLCRNNQSLDVHVMVCAPTGAAAYNVSGYTLHAAFLLPVNAKSSDDYIPLSGEKKYLLD